MRILLTGNTFHGYDTDLKQALEESGHEVFMLFNNIHGPFNTLSNFHLKLSYGILPSKLKVNHFLNQSIRSYNHKLVQAYESGKFDLFICIGAKTISQETLEKIKIPKVLWFMDGIDFYKDLHYKFHFFDSVFVFEPTDVPKLKNSLKVPVDLLNLGFNPKRFFPQKTAKTYDFSFIGSYYKNRDELLVQIARKHSQGLIIGNFKKSEFPEVKKQNTKQQISISETNQVFNQSKININIHHVQSVEGLNVRTFEILGSGNIQLLDFKKVAGENFADGEDLIYYRSEEEFSDKLSFYLQNEHLLDDIRKNAYKNALASHTWKHRTDQLIDSVKRAGIV